MKLKCIGGLADGTIIEVGDYFRDHDIVRVPAKIEFKIADFEKDLAAFREGITPESMLTPYHIYKMHSLHNINNGYKSTIKYLVPEKWSYWDSLVYLFQSHHNAT